MKKIPLFLCGVVLIYAGLFLFFLVYFIFHNVKLILDIMLIIGAIVAFYRALSRQRKQVELSYHEIRAFAALAYGILVLVFINTLKILFYFLSFLTFFYAFSKIIFCTWLLNLGQKMVYKITFVPIILGLIISIGTILMMYHNTISDKIAIKGFGELFTIIGVNILLYTLMMRRNIVMQVENNSTNLSYLT